MKKNLFTAALVLFLACFASAQNHNTLWCDKNPNLKNTHHLQQVKSTEAGKLIFIAKWGAPNGGSTLSANNLTITNGTCESCPSLGAIGSGNYKQTWTIKVTNPAQRVTLAWNTEGTINTCGTGKLSVAGK